MKYNIGVDVDSVIRNFPLDLVKLAKSFINFLFTNLLFLCLFFGHGSGNKIKILLNIILKFTLTYWENCIFVISMFLIVLCEIFFKTFMFPLKKGSQPTNPSLGLFLRLIN